MDIRDNARLAEMLDEAGFHRQAGLFLALATGTPRLYRIRSAFQQVESEFDWSPASRSLFEVGRSLFFDWTAAERVSRTLTRRWLATPGAAYELCLWFHTHVDPEGFALAWLETFQAEPTLTRQRPGPVRELSWGGDSWLDPSCEATILDAAPKVVESFGESLESRSVSIDGNPLFEVVEFDLADAGRGLGIEPDRTRYAQE